MALKSHAFFKGIDFSKINDLKPPFSKPISETYSNTVKLINIPTIKKQSFKALFPIKEGIVSKKSPYLFYNTRKIILYSDPKLEYISPSSNTVKVI